MRARRFYDLCVGGRPRGAASISTLPQRFCCDAPTAFWERPEVAALVRRAAGERLLPCCSLQLCQRSLARRTDGWRSLGVPRSHFCLPDATSGAFNGGKFAKCGLLRMPGTRKEKKRGGGKGKVRKEGTYLWPDRRKVAHAVAHFGTIRGRRQGPTRIGTVRKIRTDDRQRRRTPGQGGALTLKQGVHVCRGAGRARPAAVPTVPSGTWGYWDS